MEENKESVVGILEQLAVITDATQVLFPQGKTIMVFELNREDFKHVQGNFRGIDQYHNKFSIDISGVELVFILEGEVNYDDPTEIKVEEPPSLRKIKKSFSRFKSSSPPVK